MPTKFIILLGDGMADDPIAELKGKTPLQAAKTPHLDWLAERGVLGQVRTIPPGLPPGSDVANLSIFGYDPVLHFSGRAPLEAAAMGVRLDSRDVAFRCNLVTLSNDSGAAVMEDFSAGHISTEESRRVITDVQKSLGTREFEFYAGVSYRHLMVWRQGEKGLLLKTVPPHDISGREVAAYLPKGSGQQEISDLMGRAASLLKHHPVNRDRVRLGKKPANALWLWGQGKRPSLTPLTRRYNLTGSVISAVDLMKGIGFYAGLEIVNVPGATGYLDTNYAGKVEYALRELSRKDFVYLHIEAPDEAAHNGNLWEKIQAIEDFDYKVVGPILRDLKRYEDFRLLALPDHLTPIARKTHAAGPVPFIFFRSGDDAWNLSPGRTFDEAAAARAGLFIDPGHELMEKFIRGF